MTRRPRQHDRERGFTIIELVVAVAILGIIILPLGNFMLAYLTNYRTTLNRLADSHDIQIATAYISQDVANTGLHSSVSPYGFTQSVWTSGFPATYCGSGRGTPVALLEWDNWSVNTAVPGSPSGSQVTSSAAYELVNGTELHRYFCANSTSTPTDATLAHNTQAASVSCSTACNGATPPATVTFTLTITSGVNDQAAPAQPVQISGQRRQS